MKKILKPLFGILVLIALLVLPFFVFAQEKGEDIPVEDSSFEENNGSSNPLDKLAEIGGGGGFETNTSLPSVAGMIVNVALSLLGILFVVLIIVGGFKWMTAGGNEEQVKSATKYITRAVIGLIITLSSYAIWEFIIKRLL